MRYDIYFIFNYWKIHWRQAVIILMSYVLLVVFVFTTYSMVRTEFRRVYFDNFNFMEPNDLGSTGLQGGYNNIFSGLSEEAADALAAEGCVESSGKVYTDAYLGNGSSYYTYGAYIDDTACELSGIAMRSGRFPQMPGEAAISELAMSNMGIDARVGDTVMLTEFDEDGDSGGVREFKLCGIFKDKATRMNWETCYFQGENEQILEPVILLSPEDMDMDAAKLSVMVRLVNGAGLAGISEDEFAPYGEMVTKYAMECTDGFAWGGYDSSYFAQVPNLNENYHGFIKSAKSRFYQYAGILAAIVLAMSLVCSLSAIMPNKLKSIGMLHKAGCPLWRLRRMFVVEWAFFTAAGLAIGFPAAAGVYEALLQFQHHVFGLDIYRACQAEWGIRQITGSPAASAAAFVIPAIRLKRMLSPLERKTGRRMRPDAGGFQAYIARIFRQPAIQAMQALTLALVLVVSCAAMMFFSIKGKNDKSNPQINAQGEVFETDSGLDMRICGIDCTIENPLAASNVVYGLLDTADLGLGLGSTEADRLLMSGKFENCFAWSELWSFYGCFQEGSKAPKGVSVMPKDALSKAEKEMYRLEGFDIYEFGGRGSVLMMNDEMLERLGADLGALDAGDALVVAMDGEAPFSDAGTLSACSVIGRGDLSGMEILDSKRFSFGIAQTITADGALGKAEPLLYDILCTYEAEYLLVFSRAGAEKLGFPYKNFNHAYLSYADGTEDRDVRDLLAGVNLSRAGLSVSALSQRQQRYDRIMLKEYVVVFTIFILFILLALTGYIQALKLQAVQRGRQVAILRAVGASQKKIRRAIVLQLMKVPAVSCLLGAAGVIVLRRFTEWKHDALRNVINGIPGGASNESKAYISAYTKFYEQGSMFLTEYEMWKVPVAGLFIGLAVFVLICIYIFSKRAASRVARAAILPEKEG